MPAKERYHLLKDEGRCVNCGGPRDGEALRCTKCAVSNSMGRVGRALATDGGSEDTIQGLLLEEREKALAAAAKLDLARAVRERTTVDLIRDALIASTSYLDFSSEPAAHIPKSPPGKPETQVLLLSNLQYGRRTESFDMDTLEERLHFLMGKTMRIADLHRNA